MNGVRQVAILWPMGALVALTFVALVIVGYRRLRAGFAGRVTYADFSLGESENVPPDVAIPNRNFMNLLEMPVLFYAACLTLYVAGRVDGTSVELAWAYVALRAAHSIVHLTYNDVRHRLTLFALSNVMLAVIWIRFFLSLR